MKVMTAHVGRVRTRLSEHIRDNEIDLRIEDCRVCGGVPGMQHVNFMFASVIGLKFLPPSPPRYPRCL